MVKTKKMKCDHVVGSDGLHLTGDGGDHLGGDCGGGVCPKKIGRRAPVSGRESVEAYTPDCKQRGGGAIASQRERDTIRLRIGS